MSSSAEICSMCQICHIISKYKKNIVSKDIEQTGSGIAVSRCRSPKLSSMRYTGSNGFHGTV